MSVLVVLTVVGVVSYLSFGGTVDKFAESSRMGEATLKVLLADRNTASFRRYAQSFLTTGDEALLKRLHELQKEVAQEIGAGLAMTEAADLKQGVERLRDLTVSFNARFEQAVELRARKIAMLGEADAIGHQGRVALDEFSKTYHADAAVALPMETLMRSRLDLARFSARSTDELSRRALDLAATYAREARDLAAGQPSERQGKLAEIAALGERYSASLIAASAVALGLETLTGQVMEAIGHEISSTSNALRKLQTERALEIDHKVGDYVLHAKVTIGVLTAIAIVIAMFCAVLISRMVSRPIAEMATAARVAEEIGELIKMAAHDGDFRNRAVTEGRSGFVATISHAVNRLFDSVCTAFESIGTDAGKVALAASDASGAVVEVNAGAADQARSLEQVREAIRMSAEAITKVSGSAGAASTVADQASGLVNRGQISIAELADLMTAIAGTSREVAQITQALGHAATKTDILATTVAGEAFRLGEPGRDFTTICQQVCGLAAETRGFATRIGQLVEVTNRDLQAGAAAAASARQMIDEIHRRVLETDGMIRSIAETMMAQQSAILEIDATTNSLAEIGEHNVEAGEQISRRLVELRQLSEGTRAAIAAFKIDREPQG
ncbi:MAG: methyl-accepting chemotaxis protein [Rhodospirillaceae bacterium]